MTMTTTRRFVVLLSLMFWQGGFMFYGAVVVPIVRERLGENPERSIITQKVTGWMNLAGTLAVLAMFLDVWLGGSAQRRRRWLAWLGMALPLPIVVWLHAEM